MPVQHDSMALVVRLAGTRITATGIERQIQAHQPVGAVDRSGSTGPPSTAAPAKSASRTHQA